jgi:hypothetical protein
MKDKEAFRIIRMAVLEAVRMEKGPFNIFGRGSESRLTLDNLFVPVYIALFKIKAIIAQR